MQWRVLRREATDDHGKAAAARSAQPRRLHHRWAAADTWPKSSTRSVVGWGGQRRNRRRRSGVRAQRRGALLTAANASASASRTHGCRNAPSRRSPAGTALRSTAPRHQRSRPARAVGRTPRSRSDATCDERCTTLRRTDIVADQPEGETHASFASANEFFTGRDFAVAGRGKGREGFPCRAVAVAMPGLRLGWPVISGGTPDLRYIPYRHVERTVIQSIRSKGRDCGHGSETFENQRVSEAFPG